MNIVPPTLKNFLLLSFLLLSISGLHAQNWHPFPRNGTYHYWFQFQPSDPDTMFYSARVDSVRMEGADSAYYLYRMDRPMYAGEFGIDCHGDPFLGQTDWMLTNTDHYFGKKMLLDAMGNARFISSVGDTFSLQIHAQLGAGWAWSPGVTAMVTSVGVANVLGVPDSVKTIALTNGSSITLSKAHGFIDTYAFLPFAEPYSPTLQMDFHLCGIPSMNLGRDLPHSREIFTYAVDDKFCRYRDLREGFGHTYTYEHSEITAIIPCADPTYSYLFEREQEVHLPQPPVMVTYIAPTPMNESCPGHPQDTLLELLPYEHNPMISNQQPLAFQRGYHTFSGLDYLVGCELTYWDNYDPCNQVYFLFETTQSASYVEGLGLSESHYAFTNEINNDYYLYAFEKGAVISGNCLDLHALGVNSSSAPRCTISPNPASDLVEIDLLNTSTIESKTVRILSVDGRLLMHAEFPENSNAMNLAVSALPTGLYIVEVRQGDQVRILQKLMVAR